MPGNNTTGKGKIGSSRTPRTFSKASLIARKPICPFVCSEKNLFRKDSSARHYLRRRGRSQQGRTSFKQSRWLPKRFASRISQTNQLWDLGKHTDLTPGMISQYTLPGEQFEAILKSRPANLAPYPLLLRSGKDRLKTAKRQRLLPRLQRPAQLKSRAQAEARMPA